MEVNPEFIVVDLFCGAGGTTTGFEKTNGLAKVIACVNHDPVAIKSHWLNHADVKHFTEDIRTLDLTQLTLLVTYYRKLYPKAKLILWASLECTNFSKAKGGKARKADSRTLANHLVRYVKALNPEIIQIENVVEFMSWGPLDENGKPISKKNGRDWIKWRKKICSFGYYDEWKELNAADFGAYTSRNRLFGMFAKDRNLIYWPEPTHFKNPSKGNLFESPKKWKPVKEVLDLEDEGKSIFGRKKDLSPKTLERIYGGLVKHVANGDTAFIAKYYSTGGQLNSVNEPAGSLTVVNHHSVIQSCFLANYYSNGGELRSIENPAPTVPTRDRISKVQTVWLDKQYSGPKNHQSINNPAGSLMGNDKHALIHANRFLINPQWGDDCAKSVDKPCFTLIARMDKAPPYIVTTQEGHVYIEVFDSDSPATVKIKQFMAAYGIVDIKMRMLKIPELLKIQGFPDGYKLEGTQTDQKKFIGNSVHPGVVTAWTISISNNQLKFAA